MSEAINKIENELGLSENEKKTFEKKIEKMYTVTVKNREWMDKKAEEKERDGN